MASKVYGWDVRNTAKIIPEWPKTAFILISSKPVDTILTIFSTEILHHIRVLCVQWHQNCMSVI